MRSVTSVFWLLAACFLLSSCSGGGNEWVEIRSADGGFSVMMPPGTTKSEKMEVTAFATQKQKVHFITWKPSSFSIDKFKLFQVSYTDCPAKFTSDSMMLDVMLDSSIRMRKVDFSEKLGIPVQNIELNGYPGRAFFYDVPAGNQIVIVKQCISNGKRYDLAVIANRDQGTNPEISKFFDSFKTLQ